MPPSFRRCNDCGAMWEQTGRLYRKHMRCPRCGSFNTVRMEGKGTLIRWRVSKTAITTGPGRAVREE